MRGNYEGRYSRYCLSGPRNEDVRTCLGRLYVYVPKFDKPYTYLTDGIDYLWLPAT